MKYVKETLNLLDKLSNSWNTQWGFLKLLLVLNTVVSAIVVFCIQVLGPIFLFSGSLQKILIILIYALPNVIVFSLFYISRRHFKLWFSKKINIVLAYNLESINEERFLRKYNKFIKSLENKVAYYNMGNKIKILSCPPDVKISGDSAAEAKTRLGLAGSTVLVWGYEVRQKGKNKFKTKFSYEFGHSPKVDPKIVKNTLCLYINEFIYNKKLFSHTSVDINDLSEQLLPTCLFILGISTFTMGLFEKSEEILQTFNLCYQEASTLRKIDMKPAHEESKALIIRGYLFQIHEVLYKFDKNKEKIKELSEKILSIDRLNYDANIYMAFYYEYIGVREKAKFFNVQAENSSNSRKRYEHLFNNAYFSLSDKNYPSMINFYDSLPLEVDTDIGIVTNSLHKSFLETKIPGFLFAEGYVNFRWGDKVYGVKCLKDFRALCEIDSELDLLDKKVINLIDN